MGLTRSVKGGIFSSLLRLERIVRPAPTSLPLAEIRNVLLLQHPAALGTALHATPLIPALREALPSCRIAVAASGLALQVFRNNPGVDLLIETPSPVRDLWAAAKALRSQNPFAGELFVLITSCGNERTRVALQSLFTGVTARIGFTEVPELYSAALTFDPKHSLIDNNLRIAEALGQRVKHIEPQMFPAADDIAWARQSLVSNGVKPGQPVVVFVTQTSVTQRKSWRPERFAAAASFLIEHHGAHVLFVGTAAEAEAIEALRAAIPHPGATSSVAGKTSLLQLAALLGECRVGLTLDTGTLHVGRAVGLPMVIVAPAWSPVVEWLPVDDPRYRILKNAEMASCPPDYIIDEVSVGEVTAALEDLLGNYPSPS